MTGREQRTAFEIGQDLLARTRRAYVEDDFALFASAFMLPHEHVTMQGAALLETEQDLRVLFDRMRTQFRGMGVDDIVRPLVSAEFVTPFTILATSMTFLYCGARLVNDPYPVQSTLLNCGGDWQIATANYAITLDSVELASAIMPVAFPSELENRHHPPALRA